MTTTKQIHKIYLAGPEVFFPDPVTPGKTKHNAIARFNTEVLSEKNFNFAGLYPLDGNFGTFKEDTETAMLIFEADVALMDESDIVIANITRFRSPSADVGTAFEMGYMYARRKPVITYYNMQETYCTPDQRYATSLDCASPDSDARTPYATKVRDFANGYFVDRTTARDRDNYTHLIENFGLADNLMLIGAAKAESGERDGYHPANSFWAALQEAARAVENKNNET